MKRILIGFISMVAAFALTTAATFAYVIYSEPEIKKQEIVLKEPNNILICKSHY